MENTNMKVEIEQSNPKRAAERYSGYLKRYLDKVKEKEEKKEKGEN